MIRRPLLSLAAALLLSACSDAPGPEGRGATAVNLQTVTVLESAVPREMLFDGMVEAINQSTVAAQTGGRVVELPYDVGDYVEKDAVIVRFTGGEQRARAQSLEASAAAAKAQLAEAQLEHGRTQRLYQQDVVTRAQLDKAVAALASARANYDAAQAQLAEAREGVGYTVIRAPYAGIVVARHVKIGETVAPGTLLMTGVSLEQLRIVVEVPQRHIVPLRKHGKARIVLPEGRSVEVGELRIPPTADPVTHSFRVLLTLPPGAAGVAPGTLVKVAFVSGEEERLLLPAEALVRRGEVSGAYVIDPDGRIGLRYLRVGTPAGDGRLPVLAGLGAGERVAIDPAAAAQAYKAQQARAAGAAE